MIELHLELTRIEPSGQVFKPYSALVEGFSGDCFDTIAKQCAVDGWTIHSWSIAEQTPCPEGDAAAIDKRQFSEQIGAAIQQIGAEEATGCMARSLIYLAHSAENDFEFTSEEGSVSIKRHTIPDTAKH